MQLTETMYTLRPHAHVLGPFYMQKKARKSEPGKISVARCTGFEPVTDCLEGNCSVRLS